MEQLALGELGLSVAQFYEHTPRQFTNRVIGLSRLKNNDYQQNMERTRMLMFTQIQPHLSRSNKQKKATDLFPFPWDNKKITTTKPTPQQAAEFWNKVDKKK